MVLTTYAARPDTSFVGTDVPGGPNGVTDRIIPRRSIGSHYRNPRLLSTCVILSRGNSRVSKDLVRSSFWKRWFFGYCPGRQCRLTIRAQAGQIDHPTCAARYRYAVMYSSALWRVDVQSLHCPQSIFQRRYSHDALSPALHNRRCALAHCFHPALFGRFHMVRLADHRWVCAVFRTGCVPFSEKTLRRQKVILNILTARPGWDAPFGVYQN